MSELVLKAMFHHEKMYYNVYFGMADLQFQVQVECKVECKKSSVTFVTPATCLIRAICALSKI